MAQGTLTLFEEFALTMGNGTHDMDAGNFRIALVSESITGLASTATPNLADFTEVTGTGYTNQALTTTWEEAGGVASFKSTQGTITWNQNAGGPTDVKTGIIYQTSSTPANAAICFIDFTSDGGTTAISLVDGDITWTPDGSDNIFTATI